MSSEENSSSIGMPESEFKIDTNLVYSLLVEQHPDLAKLTIHQIDSGWDNAMFRLGDRLSVRLPRRKASVKLIENEQAWLPFLAQQLPLPVPELYRLGKPSQSYPWKWSVLQWLDGKTADQAEPQANQVKPFISFLRALHEPAPSDAPKNKVRGVPLNQRAAAVEERIRRLEKKTNLITLKVKDIWNRALNTPVDVQAKWLHGDLHTRNILVQDGIITGIIDWGDITSGDIATDLASIWMLFDDQNVREEAIAEYAVVSEATLQRAKGWAVLFGVTLLDSGLVDNSRHANMGVKILHRLSEDG